MRSALGALLLGPIGGGGRPRRRGRPPWLRSNSPILLSTFLATMVLMMTTPCGSAGTPLASSSSSSSLDNCSFDADKESLTCSLRTLNSRNASLLSVSRARSITVLCSDVFFYESYLRTNHFGYLANLKGLDLSYCKIRRVPSLAFSGLSGLESLTVMSRNSEWSAMVMEVDKDALTGLDSLKSLNLTQNNIYGLPPSVFCGLHNLRLLNLSSNFLQDITDLGFSSSCRVPLEVLDLSFNSLTVVPTSGLSQLASLRQLNLEGNNINVLEDGALAGLGGALANLNLANNELVAVPPELLKGMTNLKELYLQNNSLSSLSPGLFSDLSGLIVLNLSRNDLSSDWLNAKAFSSLGKLAALDLSSNRLTKIDRTVFSSLGALQILLLQHNQIHTVEPHAFASQVNLHILYLSHNSLEGLHPKTVQDLPHLKSLSLDHNRLRSLHRNALRNCTLLQDLALHNNALEEIPAAIRSLPTLRNLDVGENRIERISNDSFAGLANLYALSLAGNGIRQLQSNTFDTVPTLQLLNLAHNELEKTLDLDTFKALKALKVLRLDNNRLEDINGLLTTQSELRWLNISANRLLWFDFANIPKSVRWLDIHQNQLEDLGNYYSLSDGFSLVSLEASSNRLRRLGPLSLPSSLEEIFLNDNQISEIGAGTFAEKRSLKRVELRGNGIVKVSLSALAISAAKGDAPATAPEGDSSLPEFFLGNNPFLCDCDMEWLQKINQLSPRHRQYPRVMDLDDVKCNLVNKMEDDGETTTTMSRRPIAEVRPDQFLCQYQAHCFALCKCCDFFACDCRMQCPQGCSCFHDSTWSANVIQCSNRGHTGIPHLIPMDATTIYMDGNNFTGILESQAFIGRKRVKELFLNHSQIEAISNQTFNGLTELVSLHLESNLMTRLEGYEFGNLTSLRELSLRDNLLQFIHEDTFSSLVSLRVLHLQGNRLSDFPVWNLQILPQLSEVSLSENQWSCQCDFVQKFQDFARSKLIADLSRVQCVSSSAGSVVNLSDNITCTDAMAVTTYQDGTYLVNMIPILVGVIALVVVVICTSIIIFVFRTPMRVWLHSKYGIRLMDGSGGTRSGDKDKVFDAFVTYSLKDEQFVQHILVPQLEQEDPGYRLCLQHRDLPNSSAIAETFPSISHLCAKHLLVVSRSYLQSDWKQIKFAMQDYSKLRPIVLVLEELSSLDLAAAPEFNLLMKTATVLRWNDAGFWNKLRFFLPDNSMRLRRGDVLPPSVFCGNHGSGDGFHHGGSSSPVNPKFLAEWPYDAAIPSNNSSTSTRSTIMGGSPRTLNNEGGNNNASSSSAHHNNNLPMNGGGGDLLWSDRCSDSAYSWQDHTYHTISQNLGTAVAGSNSNRSRGDPIYHSLEQHQQTAVGCVDVMLPNGRYVPATLVRNAAGEIVPLVQVDSVIMPKPPHLSPRIRREPPNLVPPPPPLSEERQPLQQQVTFPRTVVYRQQQQLQQQQQKPQLHQGHNRKGHLV